MLFGKRRKGFLNEQLKMINTFFGIAEAKIKKAEGMRNERVKLAKNFGSASNPTYVPESIAMETSQKCEEACKELAQNLRSIAIKIEKNWYDA